MPSHTIPPRGDQGIRHIIDSLLSHAVASGHKEACDTMPDRKKDRKRPSSPPAPRRKRTRGVEHPDPGDHLQLSSGVTDILGAVALQKCVSTSYARGHCSLNICMRPSSGGTDSVKTEVLIICDGQDRANLRRAVGVQDNARIESG